MEENVKMDYTEWVRVRVRTILNVEQRIEERIEETRKFAKQHHW